MEREQYIKDEGRRLKAEVGEVSDLTASRPAGGSQDDVEPEAWEKSLQPLKLHETAKTREAAEARLDAIQGKLLHNKKENITATIGMRQKGELSSNKALGMSKKNGFTAQEYFTAVANVEAVFLNAELTSTRPDNKQDKHLLEVKYFEVPIQLPTRTARVVLTVKYTAEYGRKDASGRQFIMKKEHKIYFLKLCH